MATTKDERIYIRVAADVKDDFEALAQFKGLKTATFLHSLIVKTIYEARKENPQIFDSVIREDSNITVDKSAKKLEKVSVKSKKGKSGNPPKTISTSDGRILPLVNEATSFDKDEEQ